jgi:hypothetical protein
MTNANSAEAHERTVAIIDEDRSIREAAGNLLRSNERLRGRRSPPRVIVDSVSAALAVFRSLFLVSTHSTEPEDPHGHYAQSRV